MEQHSFVIEAEAEAGIVLAEAWLLRELGLTAKANPDVVILRYGLLSVDDARRAANHAAQRAFSGEHKVVIIAASRAYHEAQNALLKLFEEPSPGTHLFLVLPTLGGLLPTLRSRVQVLSLEQESLSKMVNPADAFLRGGKPARDAIVKKLASGKDEEDRRTKREEAVALVNGIEMAAYGRFQKERSGKAAALLSDIAVLRDHLYDRSAPLKMILEHLSIVTPKDLV